VGAAATDSSTENQPISNSAIAIEQVASLIQEKRWLEMILEHAGDAIAFVEPNGTVRYANPVWEQMTETTAGDTIPWPPGRDNPLVHQAIVAAIRLGHIWRGELHHTNSGGRSVDVELCITPAHDDNHRIIGYVVTQQDVAERKALENLKMRFLSDAGLELRTPVTNLKVRQYLLKQAPPDQHSMHLQALERETERLSYLVDAMLELSRMDLGLVTMTHDTTELNRLVSDVVVRYTPSAENKGVTLAFAPDDALPSIPLDQTHISRAVGILVDNAILYTPEGGHIDVRLNRETWTGGEFVIIQVKDNGIGIEPDAVPHIFERFYRSERVRDSGIRGVGLSLAIAHEIISRHNGDITVESRVNQGSIFTIWLPLKSFE
jgi:PAS domain S-box-containing protein